jgi:hypothetical protein
MLLFSGCGGLLMLPPYEFIPGAQENTPMECYLEQKSRKRRYRYGYYQNLFRDVTLSRGDVADNDRWFFFWSSFSIRFTHGQLLSSLLKTRNNMRVKVCAGIVGAALLLAGCSSSNELSAAGQGSLCGR